ncbi:hypothetical protein [Nocardia fusca]|uniref:hypothetical protein n=1 Tax=Nocardia fusca TaxID=941183 RepID=UPI001E567CDE|nr:hypothetical protein [Nocardia fusca]
MQDDIGPPPFGEAQYVFRDTQGDPVAEKLRHVHPVERVYVPVEQKPEDSGIELAISPTYSHVYGLDAVVVVQPGAPLPGGRDADIVAMPAYRVGQGDQSTEVGFELVDGHQYTHALCLRESHVGQRDTLGHSVVRVSAELAGACPARGRRWHGDSPQAGPTTASGTVNDGSGPWHSVIGQVGPERADSGLLDEAGRGREYRRHVREPWDTRIPRGDGVARPRSYFPDVPGPVGRGCRF